LLTYSRYEIRLQITFTIVFNTQFPVDPWTNNISTYKAQITFKFFLFITNYISLIAVNIYQV